MTGNFEQNFWNKNNCRFLLIDQVRHKPNAYKSISILYEKSIISCIFVCSTYSWKLPVQIGTSRDTIHHVKRKLVKSILHSSGGGATESALSSISVRPILVSLRISLSRILYFLSQNLFARENSTPENSRILWKKKPLKETRETKTENFYFWYEIILQRENEKRRFQPFFSQLLDLMEENCLKIFIQENFTKLFFVSYGNFCFTS